MIIHYSFTNINIWLGCTVGQNVVIAMAGIAKVFAGEVIENALDYKDELEDDGPIKPKHIREAARLVGFK